MGEVEVYILMLVFMTVTEQLPEIWQTDDSSCYEPNDWECLGDYGTVYLVSLGSLYEYSCDRF